MLKKFFKQGLYLDLKLRLTDWLDSDSASVISSYTAFKPSFKEQHGSIADLQRQLRGQLSRKTVVEQIPFFYYRV